MKKQLFPFLILIFSFVIVNGQTIMSDSLRLLKDSKLKAMMHRDSLKVEKDFEAQAKTDYLFRNFTYPLLKGGTFSGVLPLNNTTETPDSKIEYKLLFELTKNNPDSLRNQIITALDEVTRVINLHYASGIPVNKIMPVLVVHAAAELAFLNNDAFKKRYKMDNPNIKLIRDLEMITGAKFIICGQSMQLFGIKPEEFLPSIKISLTAQTIITSYQLKGYVLMNPNK